MKQRKDSGRKKSPSKRAVGRNLFSACENPDSSKKRKEVNSSEQDVFVIGRIILDRRIQNRKLDLEKEQKGNERKRTREGKISLMQDTDL